MRGSVAIGLALVAAGCQGVIDRPVVQIDTKVIVYFDLGVREGGPPQDAPPPPPGDLGVVDAPQTPGDPCPFGTCGGQAICVAALCRAMCTASPGGCNEKTGDCPAGTACFPATSFTDACFPATAKTGETCGGGNDCVPGNVCVKVGSAQPVCLSLCKYGCQAGQRCVQTSNNCQVCL